MGMIPECAGLLLHGKVVQKRILGSYGTLRNERRPIRWVRAFLKNPMPVLRNILVYTSVDIQRRHTMLVTLSIVLSFSSLTTLS